MLTFEFMTQTHYALFISHFSRKRKKPYKKIQTKTLPTTTAAVSVMSVKIKEKHIGTYMLIILYLFYGTV